MEIRIDSREPPKMVNIFKKKGVIGRIVTLLVGDYQYKDTIIERKTIPDFANSIRYAHLQKQLLQMQESFKNCYLIIVGNYDKEVIFNPHMKSWTLNHHLGAISSVLVRYNIKIAQVENDNQFANLVIKIFEKSYDGKIPSLMDTSLMKTKMKTSDYKLKMLCALPNVSLKRAVKLNEKLDVKIVKKNGEPVSEKYLKGIEGIGKTLAKEIMEFSNGS